MRLAHPRKGGEVRRVQKPVQYLVYLLIRNFRTKPQRKPSATRVGARAQSVLARTWSVFVSVRTPVNVRVMK
jgi:hypothetical protein